MMGKFSISIKAPGRVVFFGEHQDYIGLPVIPAAIDLFMNVQGNLSTSSSYSIDLLDLKKSLTFDSFPIKYESERDYLRSGVRVLQEEEIIPKNRGISAKITSNIPMQAGLSSSSALNVAWIKSLSEIFEYPLNAMEITKLAHRAEVLEFNEPGGMQDHMAITYGHLNFEEFNPIRCTRLLDELPGIVIGNSLEKKDTLHTLGKIKAAVQIGLDYLGTSSIKDISIDEIEESSEELKSINVFSPDAMKAARLNYEITREAHLEFLKDLENINHEKIGKLMLKHHKSLRDYLKISTFKIEKMITAAMNVGALGCKITGSGNGGCMIAYCPGREVEVSQAITKMGGTPHIAKVVHGVSSIKN